MNNTKCTIVGIRKSFYILRSFFYGHTVDRRRSMCQHVICLGAVYLGTKTVVKVEVVIREERRGLVAAMFVYAQRIL
jgi:hypothetical protein